MRELRFECVAELEVAPVGLGKPLLADDARENSRLVCARICGVELRGQRRMATVPCTAFR